MHVVTKIVISAVASVVAVKLLEKPIDRLLSKLRGGGSVPATEQPKSEGPAADEDEEGEDEADAEEG